MRLNLEEIKSEVISTGSKKVDKLAFETDIQSLQEYYNNTDPIYEYAVTYLTNLWNINIELKPEDNLLTIIKV